MLTSSASSANNRRGILITKYTFRSVIPTHSIRANATSVSTATSDCIQNKRSVDELTLNKRSVCLAASASYESNQPSTRRPPTQRRGQRFHDLGSADEVLKVFFNEWYSISKNRIHASLSVCISGLYTLRKFPIDRESARESYGRSLESLESAREKCVWLDRWIRINNARIGVEETAEGFQRWGQKEKEQQKERGQKDVVIGGRSCTTTEWEESEGNIVIYESNVVKRAGILVGHIQGRVRKLTNDHLFQVRGEFESSQMII